MVTLALETLVSLSLIAGWFAKKHRGPHTREQNQSLNEDVVGVKVLFVCFQILISSEGETDKLKPHPPTFAVHYTIKVYLIF